MPQDFLIIPWDSSGFLSLRISESLGNHREILMITKEILRNYKEILENYGGSKES